ncbi:MAG: hypothetical protein V4677_07035 [Bacteroidota bacterium]
MKKTKTLIVVYCLLITFKSLACDICGSYMGITPYDNKSSISFLHRYRVFNGYRNYQQHSHFFPKSAYRTMHGGDHADSTQTTNEMYSNKDFESYKIFELRFKYFAWKRLELNVFLPLVNNKSKTNGVYTHYTGFGDISFNAGFHAITPKADKKIRHKLIIGAGIKLPTGNFYAHDHNSDRLPFEMQPGTGSIDGFGYINYLCMSKKLGASISLNYKANGANQFQEKLSDSHNDFVSVFYRIEYKDLMFYPSVQANYEFTEGLKIKNVLQHNTQVNSLLLGPGLDIYYKSFSLNTSWQFTVTEDVRDGSLKSAGRISVGLNYSFSKREKS